MGIKQLQGAMALVKKDAAIMVRDAEAREKLIPLALETVEQTERQKTLGSNAYKMAYKDSAQVIAKEVLKLAKKD
jgi:UDP-N-acetylglucosamine--N-acetylmuramyl-(pentapeptide) pyrophosphoryl-undecaprenol N-acetylglucosamine transferase